MKNKLILRSALVFLLFSNTACISLSYLNDLARHQAKIIRAREDVNTILNEKKYDENVRSYLDLSKEVIAFMPTIGLDAKGNYESYVLLEGDAVTYAVNAAEKFKLKKHTWNYPVVGRLPYKGYPKKEDAEAEAAELHRKGFDVYVRGISAYSTLGWFNDPIFSSMLKLDKSNFVETLIHETVHLNYFAKGKADYNEQLASFIGFQGALNFYESRGDKDAVQELELKWQDAKLFSAFIAKELDSLRQWYEETANVNEAIKEKRLVEIQTRFTKELLTLLKTPNYKGFANIKLNNARLLLFGTYMKEVASMEKNFAASGLSLKEWFLKITREP